MSETQDEKLERMLASRRIEPPGPDLAQRIMLKARQTPQVQPVRLTQWLSRLFAEFHLPSPAYVVAATLLVGFVIGVNTPGNIPADDAMTISVEEFFDPDEVTVL